MCGIAGIHMKKPGSIDGHKLERFINELLLGIEHRGKDATGLAAVTVDNRVTMSKEPIAASDFIKGRPSLGMDQLRTAILHTRFATQGHQSNNANNHPVLSGTTFVTHNGHISNDDELFREFDLGRIAEVDSEAIAAMIDKYGLDKVHLALQELQGGFAIAAIDPIRHPGMLVLAKGPSSPLIFFENNNFIVWASTLNAITEAWGNVFGTPPRTWKFSQLSEGQLLYIQDNLMEPLAFKVKPSYYSSNWTGSYCGTSYSNSGSDVCSCGHTRFWHLGDDYEGSCIASEGEDRTIQFRGERCDCAEFLYAVGDDEVLGDEGLAFAMCDYCGDWTAIADMEATVENYLVCEGCMPWYNQAGSSARLPAVIEDEDERLGDLVGSDHQFPDADMTPALRLVKDDDPIYSSEELERHHWCLEKAAEKTGYAPEFIEWILFRAEIDLVANDAYLSETRDIVDTAYADADDERITWEEGQKEVGWFNRLLH